MIKIINVTDVRVSALVSSRWLYNVCEMFLIWQLKFITCSTGSSVSSSASSGTTLTAKAEIKSRLYSYYRSSFSHMTKFCCKRKKNILVDFHIQWYCIGNDLYEHKAVHSYRMYTFAASQFYSCTSLKRSLFDVKPIYLYFKVNKSH